MCVCHTLGKLLRAAAVESSASQFYAEFLNYDRRRVFFFIDTARIIGNRLNCISSCQFRSSSFNIIN